MIALKEFLRDPKKEYLKRKTWPSGCIREKSEVDLDEETTGRAASIEGLKNKTIRDNIEM
jgi:hypothetical protein